MSNAAQLPQHSTFQRSAKAIKLKYQHDLVHCRPGWQLELTSISAEPSGRGGCQCAGLRVDEPEVGTFQAPPAHLRLDPTPLKAGLAVSIYYYQIIWFKIGFKSNLISLN